MSRTDSERDLKHHHRHYVGCLRHDNPLGKELELFNVANMSATAIVSNIEQRSAEHREDHLEES
jgi:hypothetical protein